VEGTGGYFLFTPPDLFLVATCYFPIAKLTLQNWCCAF